MDKFEQIVDGIYRLCIPFDDIYTSIFLLSAQNRNIIFDTATTKEDVENYILPAIENLGITPEYIFCSHSHSDHSGGKNSLLKIYPKAKADVKSGEVLFERFKIISLKGHTKDCVGILDLKTKSLLSADGLQQAGVGKYKTYIEEESEYLKTINRLKQADIERIICSHDYEPFGFLIDGKENVLKCLEYCENKTK